MSGSAAPLPSPGAGPLPEAAWELLTSWLPSNDDPERPQITFATVHEDGGPDLRTVLLTSFDRDGFVVNTDAASRKVRQIGRNATSAIAILWPGFTRQLVIRGPASELTEPELAEAYRSRSPYLQQLAWQNTHDFAALPVETRRASWAAFGAAHPDGFEVSPTWTGFRVRPTRLTFWTSAPDMASSRREWSLRGGSWSEQVLPG